MSGDWGVPCWTHEKEQPEGSDWEPLDEQTHAVSFIHPQEDIDDIDIVEVF